MARRLFSAAMIVALIAVMVVPCYAASTEHDNTVGLVQQDLTFLGLSITSGRPGSLSGYGFFSASDGVCFKRYTNSVIDYDLTSYPYLLFVFDCSNIVGSCDFSSNLVVASPGFVCDQVRIIGGKLSDDVYNLTYLSSFEFDGFMTSSNEFSGCVLDGICADLSNYDVVVVMLHNSSSSAILDTSFSFSESIGAQSVSLSPSSSTQTITSTLSMSGVKSSGTIDIGSTYSYANAAMGGAYAANYGILKLVEYNGATYVTFNGTTNLDKALPNITSSASLSGTATLSGSSSTVSYSGTSSATTGTFTASSKTDVLAYATLSATYGDDGGLVDEVFDQGETLDDIAGDMQEIIDDMEAKSDTANDIGSATSEDTITGTQETLNSGTDALSSGLTVAGDVASVSAPAGMYIGLLTTTVTPMLNFGNGVLYWALFAVVIGSVILFLLRRLQ